MISFDLVPVLMHSYGRVLAIIFNFQNVLSIFSDTCQTYANEFNNKSADWLFSAPLCFWALGYHSTICWQCVYTILGVHICSLFKFIVDSISLSYNSLKIMLLYDLHWHSTYSMVDVYIYFSLLCGLQRVLVANIDKLC